MVTIIRLIIILLLAASVSGQDFLDDEQEQVVFIEQSLGFQSSTDATTDSTIKKHLRFGYTIFANAVAAIDFKDSILTVQNQISYDIDSHIVKIDLVYWQRDDIIKTLRPIKTDSFSIEYWGGYSLQGVDTSSVTGKAKARPSYYSWVNGKIKLFPVPYVGGDYIYVEGRARADSLLTDTGYVTDFPINYRTVPITYALWRTAVSIASPKAESYWNDLLMQAEIIGVNVDIFKK